MADSRNFRASYLERVGIKGVEEKKSLEILLKEQPLDVSKLSQFFLRCPVPAAYRLLLWKVLLGVVPTYSDVHEFVEAQRRIQYDDMHEALDVMGRIHSETPLPEVHLRMHLMNQGFLPFDESKMFQDKDNQVFLSIASTVAELFEEPVEIFWISSHFFKLQDKYRHAWPLMVERISYHVKEEGDAHLHAHLQKLRVFTYLPFTTWFYSCFSGTLPENCLERIWDKVIGGSCQILMFVAISILVTLKHPLMNMKSTDDVTKFLTKIPQETGDRIVSNAIDMWQKYGCLLMPGVNKPDSPAFMTRKT